VFVRTKGKPKGQNVTTALTTITLADSTACGPEGTTVGLFAACLSGYFWKADNSGLRLLQLRFSRAP
jgi:hypothetical protein